MIGRFTQSNRVTQYSNGRGVGLPEERVWVQTPMPGVYLLFNNVSVKVELWIFSPIACVNRQNSTSHCYNCKPYLSPRSKDSELLLYFQTSHSWWYVMVTSWIEWKARLAIIMISHSLQAPRGPKGDIGSPGVNGPAGPKVNMSLLLWGNAPVLPLPHAATHGVRPEQTGTGRQPFWAIFIMASLLNFYLSMFTTV